MAGDSPPCMHRIRFEINAATGMQLKHFTNDFHNLGEYFLQPINIIRLRTLVVKPIDFVQGSCFMIAPEQDHIFGVSDFVG